VGTRREANYCGHVSPHVRRISPPRDPLHLLGDICRIHRHPNLLLAPWRARIDNSRRGLPLVSVEVAPGIDTPVGPPSDSPRRRLAHWTEQNSKTVSVCVGACSLRAECAVPRFGSEVRMAVHKLLIVPGMRFYVFRKSLAENHVHDSCAPLCDGL
jgi:hypothetical protein